MSVPVTPATARRYLDLHALLPKDVECWSDDLLDELLEELDEEQVDTWERVLMLLAHHRSPKASDLIEDLRRQAPPELDEFCELAYAESLGWLGFDYVRNHQDALPTVTPAGDMSQVAQA